MGRLTYWGSSDWVVKDLYVSTTLAIAAPIISLSEISASSVKITWPPVSGATGYRVYTNNSLSRITTETSYSVSGLTAGTKYSFYVQAYNSTGLSVNSNTVNHTPTLADVSTLSISGVTTIPNITQGTGVSIAGLIKSNYNITSVTVGIYPTSNGETSYTQTTTWLNASSYNISALDSLVKFGSVPAGTGYFRVTATETQPSGIKVSKVLVNQPFLVSASGNLEWFSKDFWETKKSAGWINPIPTGSSYRIAGGGFNSSREDENGNPRSHAGIDYIADVGTPVIAMCDGKVMHVSDSFYYGTGVVEVHNNDGTVIRYCEIKPSVKEGDTVTKGKCLGKVIANTKNENHMLHLEVYLGSISGDLTQRDNNTYLYVLKPKYGSYERRADLLDPTDSQYLSRQ
ncbi:MAG TPA: hypothetical protein DEQ30_05925 [Porphyromonadaceae bacterium]|nr:hypothetical protein [Porphyromonadaceae bacterium]